MMSRLFQQSLLTVPPVAAAVVIVWCARTPLPQGPSSGAEQLIEAIRAAREKADVQQAAPSPLQDLSAEVYSRPLRPDLTPVSPKTSPPAKKNSAPPGTIVVRPPPPLRVSLALIGTVIESDRSHAVIRNREGVVIVVRPGEKLPAPDRGLTLVAVTPDSATVSSGEQTAVIIAEKK